VIGLGCDARVLHIRNQHFPGNSQEIGVRFDFFMFLQDLRVPAGLDACHSSGNVRHTEDSELIPHISIMVR
jgi:hypothetical protein